MKKLSLLCVALFIFASGEAAQKDANATVSAPKILPAGEKTQTEPKNLAPAKGVANATAAKQSVAPQAAKKNANTTKSANKSAAKTLATAKDMNSTDSNASGGAKKQDANASGAKLASGAKKPDENASDPNASAAKLDTNAAKPAPSASQPLGALPPVVPDEIPIRSEILPAATSTPPAAPPPPLKNFTSRSFSLPSDALAIEQITVRYTGSDGVSREKIIDINRSINWQDDFVISASAKPTLQRALDVSVTSNDPNLKNQSPLSTSSASFAPRLELPLETLKFDDGLKFVIHQNNVQIITADDFKSSDANASGTLEMELWRQEIPLSGASFAVNIGGFSDINVTKEDGYYRIGVRSREGNLSIRRKDGGYLIYKN